ncbi:hypothetical protein KI387_030567, partial [Taxus chinensis]
TLREGFESAFSESVTPPDSPVPSPTNSEAAGVGKEDSSKNKGIISSPVNSDDEDYDGPDAPPHSQEEPQ